MDPEHTHPVEPSNVLPATTIRLTPSTTGEIVLPAVIHPDTSEQTGGMTIHDATTEQLAAWRDAVRVVLGQADEVVAVVDRTINERFDKTGRWTHYAGAFKVVGKSPNPGYTYPDPAKLRRALLRLVDKGELEADAVDLACPVVPEQVTVSPSVLLNLMKVPAVAPTIKRHRKETPVGKRGVRVTYMGTRRNG